MKHVHHRWIRRTLALCSLALLPTVLLAQSNYPERTVRAVMPYGAGSGPDAVMRHVGEFLSQDWGQSVVVDNKPGANGWLSIGEVKRAKPDGHTLLALDGSYLALQPHLYRELPFDPVKDFDPVAGLYTTGFFIVVKDDSPWQSVADIIAAAKAYPGAVRYGTWGIGSVAHLGAAQLEAAADIQMLHVPFKQLSQLYVAVANGDIDWAFGSAATVDPLYRAGKVRLLAYAQAQRLATHADVPTVAESGGPADLVVGIWVALFAPKGTALASIERIQTGVAATQEQADMLQRLTAYGFQPWRAGPADLASTLASDTAHYATVVQRARISLD